MAKTKAADAAPQGDEAIVVVEIVAHPTASDAQVAAVTGVDRAVVMDVRAGMGAKHTWPKATKEENE